MHYTFVFCTGHPSRCARLLVPYHAFYYTPRGFSVNAENRQTLRPFPVRFVLFCMFMRILLIIFSFYALQGIEAQASQAHLPDKASALYNLSGIAESPASFPLRCEGTSLPKAPLPGELAGVSPTERLYSDGPDRKPPCALSVTCGDTSPKGRGNAYPRFSTCFQQAAIGSPFGGAGAERLRGRGSAPATLEPQLPLPLGEVDLRSKDGEGEAAARKTTDSDRHISLIERSHRSACGFA